MADTRIRDLTPGIANSFGASWDWYNTQQLAKQRYNLSVANALAAQDNQQLTQARTTINSLLTLMNSATDSPTRKHYLGQTQQYYGTLPERHQKVLWPLVSDSPLNPSVRKVQTAVEGLKAAGKILPGNLSKVIAAAGADKIHDVQLASWAMEEADSQYAIDTAAGLNPIRPVIRELPPREVPMPNGGTKMMRYWAYRPDEKSAPVVRSEIDFNFADIEKRYGKDPGHILQNNGYVVNETAAVANGQNGVMITKINMMPEIPGRESVITEWRRDKSYEEREYNERKKIEAENRAERRQISKEVRDRVDTQVKSVANFTALHHLASWGQISDDELLKSPEGITALAIKRMSDPKGFFGDKPPMTRRFAQTNFLKTVYPDVTIVFGDKGNFDWKWSSPSSWFNKDYYFPGPGEHAMAIPNSEIGYIQTKDPSFSIPVIIDYNSGEPIYRELETGRKY